MKRSQWIEKFLGSEPIQKLAFKIEANYVDRVKILMENTGKGSTKWSSIEEALEDFAARNGFSRTEMKALQKAASVKLAQENPEMLKKLQEEGLGSQAVEYMSKSKNKHTKDTASPFVLTKKDVGLKQHLRDREKGKRDLTDSSNPSEHNNEFATTNTGAIIDEIMRKYGQENKIIDMPAGVGSPEALETLSKELRTLDIKTPYKILRHGFRFTGVDDRELSQKGEPVKVTVYQYSFLKRNVADALNETLREQLKKELPVEEWIAYFEQNKSAKTAPLLAKLKQLQRDLYSEQAAYVETAADRTPPKNIKRILQMFPASYQFEILKMLAEGRYRHLTGEEGRKHAELFASGYRLGSFILMESFEPYVQITPQFKDTEQAKAFIGAIVNTKQNTFSYDEFAKILDSIGVVHSDVPTQKDYQSPKFGPIQLRIGNKSNPNYKPVTNELDAAKMKDPEAIEEQLAKFQDKIASVLMEDIRRIENAKTTGKRVQLTPLVYEKQPDGSYKPLSLLELEKKDYTTQKIPYVDTEGNKVELDNPHAGVHPTYQGKFDQVARMSDTPLSKLKQPGKWQHITTGPQSAPKEKKEESKPKQKGKWEHLTGPSSKGLKKFEFTRQLLVRLAAMDLWISDRGEAFPTEQQMKESMVEETLQEAKPGIVDDVATKLMQFVEQLPDEKEEAAPTTQPEPKEEEAEEEPMALAAGTLVKLKKVASTINSPKLNELLKKYER